MTDLEPRIYVASLADYNAGRLHGRWIDAAQDADEIHREIQAMLAESPEHGEEWAIHDYEGFAGSHLSEYEDIERIAKLAAALSKPGPAFAFVLNGDDPDRFEDAYVGEADSEQEYAEELFNDLFLADVPENVRAYIDYDAFARDLFINDYWSSPSPDGGVFVFRRDY